MISECPTDVLFQKTSACAGRVQPKWLVQSAIDLQDRYGDDPYDVEGVLLSMRRLLSSTCLGSPGRFVAS